MKILIFYMISMNFLKKSMITYTFENETFSGILDIIFGNYKESRYILKKKFLNYHWQFLRYTNFFGELFHLQLGSKQSTPLKSIVNKIITFLHDYSIFFHNFFFVNLLNHLQFLNMSLVFCKNEVSKSYIKNLLQQ